MSKFDDYYQMIMEALGVRVRADSEKGLYDAATEAASQKAFVDICASNGYVAKKSTPYQDMVEHIDYVVWDQNKKPVWADRPENRAFSPETVNTVEVKNEKEAKNGDFIAEIRNVEGNEGWLYGKAHYIATFDSNVNGFRMLNREKFKARLENQVGYHIADRYQGLTHIPLSNATNKPVDLVRNKDLSKAKSFYLRGQDMVLQVPYAWVALSTEFILKSP